MRKKKFPILERDLSWLSFNHRVLQEAKDPSVPLLDRLKFMAIYSSNLEEFFKVRVAQIRNILKAGRSTHRALEFDPKKLMKDIMKVVNQNQQELSTIFNKHILPELRYNGIYILKPENLNTEQLLFVDNYFRENLQAFVQPVLLMQGKVKPFLNSGALYLVLDLTEKSSKNVASQYAIVRVPSDQLARFVILPTAVKGEHHIMFLDDVVRLCVRYVFPGYLLNNAYSIKLTRDSELYIDDEYTGDLLSKIRKSLTKRNVGPASRLVYDRTLPVKMIQVLKSTFDLESVDLIPEGKYHNNFDFFKFPDFGKTYLKEPNLPPLPYLPLEGTDDIFKTILLKDHFIQVPYFKYESVIRLFEDAAKDETVSHISAVQYRVAKESRIMEALIDAARAGKKVSVFIEVKARFDEEANIRWGEKLEKAGVNVKYSLPGLKVHAKIALIRRIEKRKPVYYSYLSTGNFNEDTALMYSDFGLFTADTRLTSEVKRLFDFLESGTAPTRAFRNLMIGQFNLRSGITELIEYEIGQAKAGKKANMLIKLNSLEDKQMIQLLYKAGAAGVKIQLIIRGICCLVSSLKKISQNIEAASIVDRYLEHARVFVFYHGGKQKIYLSSADWMQRNLNFRIETAFPVYDQDIREKILHIMELQWRDNVKARDLAFQNINKYRRNGGSISIRSQLETYNYFHQN